MTRVRDVQIEEIMRRRNLKFGDPRYVSREAIQFALDRATIAARLQEMKLTDKQFDDFLAGRLIHQKESKTVSIIEAPAPVIARPLLSLSAEGELLINGLNPQAFWDYVFKKNHLTRMHIPDFPTLTPVTTQACLDFGLIPVFCPVLIIENLVAGGYIVLDRSRHLESERCRLLGCWILFETVPKPNLKDLAGYGADDKVAELLGLQHRFSVRWDTLHDGRLNRLIKTWGLQDEVVRLPTVEEMNWVGNLFLMANHAMSTNLPNLGSTNIWEWCENYYGSGNRLVFGSSDSGGLAAIYSYYYDKVYYHIGFRVLVVLSNATRV